MGMSFPLYVYTCYIVYICLAAMQDSKVETEPEGYPHLRSLLERGKGDGPIHF
jgi:hypothetical protein